MRLPKAATETAAKVTGLRPDQVEHAVNEYRKAAEALHQEPQWTALMHMSFRDGGGIAQYGDPSGETSIILQIETDSRGDEARVFVLEENAFDLYGEARAAELLENAKQKPHVVR